MYGLQMRKGKMHALRDWVGEAESKAEETAKGEAWHSVRKAR